MKTRWVIGVLIFCSGTLRADTVLLKNGRVFTNAKAALGEKELEIESEDGRIYVFPIGDLKTIEYLPVNKPAKRDTEPRGNAGEKSRDIPPDKSTSGGGTADEKNPVSTSGGTPAADEKNESCGFGRPVIESLIPLWSRHFCDGRTKLGIGFAAADAFLFYAWTQWSAGARTRADDPNYLFTGLLLGARQQTDEEKIGTVLLWNALGKDLVYTPHGIVLDRTTWRKRRNGVLALFVLTAFADAATVWWFSAGRTDAEPRTSQVVPQLNFFIGPDDGKLPGHAFSVRVSLHF